MAAAIMKDLYRPLYLIETPVVVTNVVTAEVIKYAANAFLATKISFINEMADLCEKVGADVHDVARGMGLDQRIGRKFLHPGPGYGGSCFPKDTRAILELARDNDVPLKIVAARHRRQRGPRSRRRSAKVRKALGGTLEGKTVGLLGLHVQAQHRRPEGVSGDGDPRRNARRGRQGPGLRPDRHADRRPIAARRRALLRRRIPGRVADTMRWSWRRSGTSSGRWTWNAYGWP